MIEMVSGRISESVRCVEYGQTVLWFVSGKKLSDLERVTSLKVYNWFANRRKEIKRRANIGNVALGR